MCQIQKHSLHILVQQLAFYLEDSEVKKLKHLAEPIMQRRQCGFTESTSPKNSSLENPGK